MGKASLKVADSDLHKFGTFTNRFGNVRVDFYTNRFSADGVDFQCELAARCERLTNRGFLAITTNRIFVWIETKGTSDDLSRFGWAIFRRRPGASDAKRADGCATYCCRQG